MRQLLKTFRDDEAGTTAIEYALIASIVSMSIVASLQLVGPNLNVYYNKVATGLK